MFSAGRYFAMREKSSKLPHVKVTKEEMIQLLLNNGATREKAEQTVLLAEQLGSEVMIGERMVGLQKSEED